MLAAISNESNLPSQLQQSTRAGYWSSWKTVLTESDVGGRSRQGEAVASHESGHAEGHHTGVLDDQHVGRHHSELVVCHRGPTQAVLLYCDPTTGDARRRFRALQPGSGFCEGHAFVTCFFPRRPSCEADAGAFSAFAGPDARRAHVRSRDSHVYGEPALFFRKPKIF